MAHFHGSYVGAHYFGDGAVPSGLDAVVVTFGRTDDDDALVSQAAVWGVLGSTVPATGDDGPALLYNEVVAYALQSNYVNFEILSVTAGYTLVTYPNSSFDCYGPIGLCTVTYRFSIDGVWQAGTGSAEIEFDPFPVYNIYNLSNARYVPGSLTDAAVTPRVDVDVGT